MKKKVAKLKFVIFPKKCVECGYTFYFEKMWHFFIKGKWQWCKENRDYQRLDCNGYKCQECIKDAATEKGLPLEVYIKWYSQDLIRQYRN